MFDWNQAEPPSSHDTRRVLVVDETLREGLQSPSVTDPAVESKLELLHFMDRVGVDVATVGMPSSGPRAFADCLRLCAEVARSAMSLRPACSARTLPEDIEPIADIAQRTGKAVEAFVFIGSSPIRQSVQGWDLDWLLRRTESAIHFAVKAGLTVSYVTEDTTRSSPEVLASLFRCAISCGARTLCLADTAGYATPAGVRNLMIFARRVIAECGAPVDLDFHGHNDRGLALANTWSAMEAGADRVHGTVLGMGERVGNAPLELILLNLHLAGRADRGSLSELSEYVRASARAFGWTIAGNAPLVGADAFRTSSGVHADALLKAESRADEKLVDDLYSAVRASEVGRRQEIGVGPMSGASNVVHWLRRRQVEISPALVASILRRAKQSVRWLSDDEMAEEVRAFGKASQGER